MTEFQKMIKYLAIILAIALSIAIIVGILGGLSMIFWFGNNNTLLDESINIDTSQNINSIHMEIDAAALKIVEGERFLLSTNIKDLRVNVNSGTLVITHKQKKVAIHSTDVGEIVLTVPKGTVFEYVEIEAGAGDIDISKLEAGRVDLEFGAGRVDIDHIAVNDGANIETGAGQLNIKSGHINDLDLDLGVGESNIRALLNGKTEINCGVGKMNLTVCGNQTDYTLKISTGIGSVYVNGSHIKGNAIVGNGAEQVRVEGGIGSINIDFEND